jgi:hypothetical protein
LRLKFYGSLHEVFSVSASESPSHAWLLSPSWPTRGSTIRSNFVPTKTRVVRITLPMTISILIGSQIIVLIPTEDLDPVVGSRRSSRSHRNAITDVYSDSEPLPGYVNDDIQGNNKFMDSFRHEILSNLLHFISSKIS